MDLSDYRQKLDQIDDQILSLFTERMDIAAEIAAWKRENSLPVLDVYVARIADLAPFSEPLSGERKKELKKVKNEDLRLEKKATWALMLRAVEHSFHYTEKELSFEKTREGKWLCDKCCISLSHSGTLAAAAVSHASVGVDLEEEGPFLARYEKDPDRLASLARHALTEKERERPLSPGRFLTLWTEKEAAFKREGTGALCPSGRETDPANTAVKTIFVPCRAVLAVSGEPIEKCRFFLYDGSPRLFRGGEWEDRKEGEGPIDS